ncbi:MAG: radical SAM protein [Deltaproteobacteria bacterium]|nr:radical SAM protein [Deltaproteobacteria bacterium]
MKIALVIPRNSSESDTSFYDFKFGTRFLLSRKHISYLLAIPTLTSLTPPEHEIRVFDENIEDIDYTWKADLAGITVRTMFAQRAYAISETYRTRGAKTVLGGIHPSMCPEDALPHCDSVVIGEAEETWHTVLQDAENGHLKRLYKAHRFADLGAAPITDRSSLSKKRYLLDIVQTTKGCPFHCEFCSVHAFDGQRIRSKTIEQVIREIQGINSSHATYKKKNAIFFADDNIIADKAFAKQLFLALQPYKINWMCQASINISQEAELLELMRDSGCGAVFIGFESICDENLAMMHKGINQRYKYIEAIRKIQSYGLLVHSSFILGYDFDSQATFDELINFIRESNLLMPLINILTPFPGTKLFKRLEEEGRILHKDWSKYDTQHVVFLPARMSPEDLLQGYRKVVRSVYSFDSILRKLNYYWDRDFWKRSNEFDPVKFVYRLLFAVRLATLLISGNMDRSKFIMKILPLVFDKRVRISTILALMNNNDFACTL